MAISVRHSPRDIARASIASSLGAPTSLLPHLPRLLHGLDSLGGRPRMTANALARAGLRKGGLAIELACGRGSLAIELARRGVRVLAIDACASFVADAEGAAARAGVSHLCTFHVADARRPRTITRSKTYDAAIMIGLDGIETAAPLLRSLVCRGGVYAMDDAVARIGHADRAPTLTHCHELFESLGDRVVSCTPTSMRDLRRQRKRIMEQLTRNARALSREHPRVRGALMKYVAAQDAAADRLETELRPVLWIVRKG